MAEPFDQMTINDYSAGTYVHLMRDGRSGTRERYPAVVTGRLHGRRCTGEGISPHVDTHSIFGDLFGSISLSASTVPSLTHASDNARTVCVPSPSPGADVAAVSAVPVQMW